MGWWLVLTRKEPLLGTYGWQQLQQSPDDATRHQQLLQLRLLSAAVVTAEYSAKLRATIAAHRALITTQ